MGLFGSETKGDRRGKKQEKKKKGEGGHRRQKPLRANGRRNSLQVSACEVLALHESDTGELAHTLFTPTHTGVNRRANASLSEKISGSCNLYYLIRFSMFAFRFIRVCLLRWLPGLPISRLPLRRTLVRTLLHSAADPHSHFLQYSVYDCLEQQIFVCDQRGSLKSLFQND